jgi:hypothetical protein
LRELAAATTLRIATGAESPSTIGSFAGRRNPAEAGSHIEKSPLTTSTARSTGARF